MNVTEAIEVLLKGKAGHIVQERIGSSFLYSLQPIKGATEKNRRTIWMDYKSLPLHILEPFIINLAEEELKIQRRKNEIR